MKIPTIKEIVEAVHTNPNITAEELGLSEESLKRVRKSDAFNFLKMELEAIGNDNAT